MGMGIFPAGGPAKTSGAPAPAGGETSIEDTIIKALRDYFQGCPLTQGGTLNVDSLADQDAAYSIDPVEGPQVLQQYVGGSSLRQYTFALRSAASRGEVQQNLAGSGFSERLGAWMEQQTRARALPALGGGRTPYKLEAVSTGHLFETGPDIGKYEIQCRLVYLQKGERTL